MFLRLKQNDIYIYNLLLTDLFPAFIETHNSTFQVNLFPIVANIIIFDEIFRTLFD